MIKKDDIKLSFVILTWNSEKFIKNCLESLEKGAKGLKYEVIIIDNGSKDNTVELINRFCPQAFIIKNPVNKGTTAPRNQGIKKAKGKYIAVLDIDTYLLPEAISKMVSYMEDKPELAICAPRLTFKDGDVQENARKFPTIFTKILRRIDTKWAKRILDREIYYDLKKINSPIKVDYAITACQVIRKEALDKIKGLDEKIFYAPEDIDLCLRMWLKGWEVVYYPYSEVVHYEQRLTKKKPLSWLSLQHIKGLIYYFIKHGYFFSKNKLYKKIEQGKKG